MLITIFTTNNLQTWFQVVLIDTYIFKQIYLIHRFGHSRVLA